MTMAKWILRIPTKYTEAEDSANPAWKRNANGAECPRCHGLDKPRKRKGGLDKVNDRVWDGKSNPTNILTSISSFKTVHAHGTVIYLHRLKL